jgi:hypothetical protein
MPDDVQHRFDMLQGRFIDTDYVVDYFGIDDILGNVDLVADMARYRAAFDNAPAQPDMIDRYVLEGFLQARRLLPKQWAAARLGMKPAMLDRIILHRMDLPTPLRKQYIEYECLVEEGIAEELIRVLPLLRFKTFYDHESFCGQLHMALRQALNISEADMQSGALWCATDDALNTVGLGDYPRRYGFHFDCLTCEPLSVAHAIWLDFEKPLTLSPDRCSKLTFVRYHEDLGAWAAGTRAPDDLERYEEFAAGVH